MNYKTKGVVLISVLLIVLLLSSIAVVIGNNYFVSFKRAQYLELQTVSLNIFSSIESLALKKIDNYFKNGTSLLLHGVTGSGKTEIYIQLIAQQLKKNKKIF